MNIIKKLSDELAVREEQVAATIGLIDDGCTIPFIARYRKEKTGGLDDGKLRKLSERLTYLRTLEENRVKILAAIEEQGALTEELKKKIDAAETETALEDLYRPYRKKKKTRASVAKERGLEPLANIILLQMTKDDLSKEAEKYIAPEKEVPDAEAALHGAMDIIAERISEDPDLREMVRNETMKTGILESEVKKSEGQEEGAEVTPYENYYHFSAPLGKLTGYQILAINRGEKEGVLRVKLSCDSDVLLKKLEGRVIVRDNPRTSPLLREAIKDSYSRLTQPAVERDIRNALTERAEDGAIDVFEKNLRQLLMQPPIAGVSVLGWDPAFRTGCKLAVTDPTGKVLDTAVIFPTEPTNDAKIAAAKKTVLGLIKKYNITLISLGNGTASRESEQLISEWIRETPGVSYIITNESGASVYSASEVGAEEFPDYNVGQRSAVSMARRAQDPLAELVKMEPKAIGVGQYQHDMDQKKLTEALSGVVESCVNSVGADLNTASWSLLSYVAGLTKTTAKNIVSYRDEKGLFRNRRELLKVKGLGPKSFEQCAGFLRIRGGDEPLDATAVHPESYEAARELLKEAGNTELSAFIKQLDLKREAEKLDIGLPTLKDITEELLKPGRDPREDMPKPLLRSDVLTMEDLTPGMILKGTVRNVVDFGAFVDIGVHQDGLVHISKLTDKKFVKHPLEVVSVGDIVEVKVIEADIRRKRISLSMIL